MARKNKLLEAPPYDVEKTLKGLGANLRTARMRRNLTIQDVADKIGTGPRAVSDAEKGKLSTGIGTYAALLWSFDLLDQLQEVADPLRDKEGAALARTKEGERVRGREVIDNDF